MRWRREVRRCLILFVLIEEEIWASVSWFIRCTISFPVIVSGLTSLLFTFFFFSFLQELIKEKDQISTKDGYRPSFSSFQQFPLTVLAPSLPPSYSLSALPSSLRHHISSCVISSAWPISSYLSFQVPTLWLRCPARWADRYLLIFLNKPRRIRCDNSK